MIFSCGKFVSKSVCLSHSFRIQILFKLVVFERKIKDKFHLRMFRFYKTLPSLNGVRTQLQEPSLRTLTFTQTLLKKSSQSETDPEAEVILLSTNGTEKKMKYGEVLEKVGGRKLVKIKRTKGSRYNENLRTF